MNQLALLDVDSTDSICTKDILGDDMPHICKVALAASTKTSARTRASSTHNEHFCTQLWNV